MKRKILTTALIAISTTATAQTDSVKTELRRFTARNFSEERTLNLYWETASAHNYTLKKDGEVIGRGRMRNENTVKFTTVIPVVDKSRFTLNAKGYANFFVNDLSSNDE